ncbi:MAG: hypothetical protein K0S24_4578 [Sphingobacterium sp.]|jgi:ribosomal-protein-alanine N-acetyltransferase|nr:hypothetical protein [Sphingobacterium sp.]
MKHMGTKALEKNRLILRCFNIDDAQAMFDNWASNVEVTKYLTWPAHKDVSVSKAYIESLIQNYSNANTYDWGIELKKAGQVIGSWG